MPTVTGRDAVQRYFANSRTALERSILPGAARAAAKIIADEIKAETPAEEVRDNLRTRMRREDGRVVVTIDIPPGWARSVGIWLEWGTAPHLISVDPSQSGGRSAGRINRLAKEKGVPHQSLVIGGKFVGSTVWHPGARPHPAFRPAMDKREAEAIAAAQAYINTRVARGIDAAPAAPDEGDA